MHLQTKNSRIVCPAITVGKNLKADALIQQHFLYNYTTESITYPCMALGTSLYIHYIYSLYIVNLHRVSLRLTQEWRHPSIYYNEYLHVILI